MKNTRVQERRKNTAIKKYGINVNQYRLMLEEQGHKCYICNQSDSTDLAVDHCHTTGKVRGLLCRQCNRALGMLMDSTEYLQKAIEYLSRDYIVPDAPNFSEYIPHEQRPRWKVRVTTPDGQFDSIAAAAKFYNKHETSIHGYLGRLPKQLHLKKDGWLYEKVFN